MPDRKLLDPPTYQLSGAVVARLSVVLNISHIGVSNCKNRVKKTKLMHTFLVYFVNLYMFRTYLGPSSGGTTVCVQQFVLIILFR